MRIVGGIHRGRVLEGPGDDASIRPTSDRARESLFNILEHGRFTAGGVSPLRGARILDAFCGVGALGLEALSRGAAQAVFIDQARTALDIARRNARTLDLDRAAEFAAADATKPPKAAAPCAIAFLDPPYGEGLAPRALAALAAAGWFAPGALIAVETGPRDAVEPPSGFGLEDSRRYGKARLGFYRFLSPR